MKREYESPEFSLHKLTFEGVLRLSDDETYHSQIDDPDDDPFG